MSRKGRLVIVSGPSGVGKTTVVAELLRTGGLVRSVSATTRPPRGQERDGVDYFFLSEDEFERKAAAGGFLEHAVINGRRYGTPREAVDRAVAAGQVVVLAIDVQGAAALRAMGVDFVGVFILPPSVDELRRRLAGRGDTTPQEVERRMRTAMRELEQKDTYDVVVTNVTVNETVEAVLKELRDRNVL